MSYASLNDEQATAPGQLSASLLLERFRFRSLSPQTALYGLIGEPIEHSIGDITHNQRFKELGYDALYVKMQVKPKELGPFLHYAKQLPFRGLSVTMPLKEEIMPYLDEIDPVAKQIGAVNTLVMRDGQSGDVYPSESMSEQRQNIRQVNRQIIGYNTDGKGALDALEKHRRVKGMRMIILGSGGAAKAIIYEAQSRGALVIVLSRDAKKANEVAQRFHCQEGLGLDKMTSLAKEGYDVLINCTPIDMPIEENAILSQALIMDIRTRPKITPFLQCALNKGCSVVYGEEMFLEQAKGQYQLWIG